MASAIERAPAVGDSARPTLQVEMTWRGGLRFQVTDRTGARAAADADAAEAGLVARSQAPVDAVGSGASERPAGAWVDGDASVAPSPMETLLVSLGGCGGSDVVEILRKGRQDVTGIVILLVGERRPEVPRRYVRIRVRVTVRGRRIERAKAERAVRLAFESYCSVGASLDPALVLEREVVVEEEPRPAGG